MLGRFKKILYFPIAYYFRFFAGIRLKRWNPKIVVVTGSNGKTTLLHLIEAQIGENAKYSHFANSSFGIPFDILDLQRKTLLKSEWIGLFIKAPFNVWKKLPKEKLYIVEADCDRPGEGNFLGSFLEPAIVLWISSARTHSINFEKLVKNKSFASVDEAIAYEFGYFLEYASEAILINGDSDLINRQLVRANVKHIDKIEKKSLTKYSVDTKGTKFSIYEEEYMFKYILPEEIFYSIIATKILCEKLNISFDHTFKNFKMPPGRGSLFKGIKETTIVDSSYNSTLSSAKTMIISFAKISTKNKWVVIGDMLELGESTPTDHEKLADVIIASYFQKVILMGPRVGKYTFPRLSKKGLNVVRFDGPKETLDYILENISGGEAILFKGARFMEGIIEGLLADKKDVKILPRREKAWEIRRRQWGL